jgi:hypothetical protein
LGIWLIILLYVTKGVYIVSVQTEYGNTFKRLVIQWN